MSVNWIQMRTLLADDPRTLRIANLLKINEDEVVGKLHKIWSWATDHLTNGKADGVTVEWIDRYMRCPGWGDSMLEVKWLKATKTGLLFPEWQRYLSQGAKTRALTARRMERSRTERNKCDAASVTKTSPQKEKEKEKDKRKTTAEQEEKSAAVSTLVDFEMNRKQAGELAASMAPGEAAAAVEWCRVHDKTAAFIVWAIDNEPRPWLTPPRSTPAKARQPEMWDAGQIAADAAKGAKQ